MRETQNREKDYTKENPMETNGERRKIEKNKFRGRNRSSEENEVKWRRKKIEARGREERLACVEEKELNDSETEKKKIIERNLLIKRKEEREKERVLTQRNWLKEK